MVDGPRFKREWLDESGAAARPGVTVEDADPLVAGTQLDQDRIAVSWTPVPRASYYELDISTDPAFLNASTTVKRTCKTPNTEWTPYLWGPTPAPRRRSAPCAWTGTQNSAAPALHQARARPTTCACARSTRRRHGRDRGSRCGPTPRDRASRAPAALTFTTKAVPADRRRTRRSQPAPLSLAGLRGTPRLTWEPVAGAEAYLVLLALTSTSTRASLTAGPTW